MAQLGNTQVNGDLKVNGGISLNSSAIDKTVFDLIYPVGTLYWTSDSAFDPNTSFGGKWIQITNKFIFAKGDKEISNENINGKIKLTIDQLPSHTHNISHTHKYKPEGIIKNSKTGVKIDTKSLTLSGGSHWHYVAGSGWHTKVPLCTYCFGGQYNGANGIRYYYWKATEIDDDTGYLRTGEGEGGHSHNVNHSHTIADNGHIHTFEGTEETISDVFFSENNKEEITASDINIMPPYVVKYCWERTGE